jgi:hypothetical protein
LHVLDESLHVDSAEAKRWSCCAEFRELFR